MVYAIVIDDDHETVEVLVEYLEFLNIRISGKGYNGLDAVTLYDKLHPDIVFIDINMEPYDGIYGITKIKKINPNARIIAVTADMSQVLGDQLTNLKVEVIYKPYDIQSIKKLLNIE